MPAVLSPVRLARWRKPAACVDVLHQTLAVRSEPRRDSAKLTGLPVSEVGLDDRPQVGSRRWPGKILHDQIKANFLVQFVVGDMSPYLRFTVNCIRVFNQTIFEILL